jgi:Flp pilus assembly pilin Flp
MSARILACGRTRLAQITRNEAGQSTAEYALVILGAVAIATLLITWATGSHAISQLFDSVIQKILPS